LVNSMLQKLLSVFFLCSLMFGISAYKTGLQPVTYITLQNQALKIIPKEFYITAVIDGRKDITTIGSLQATTNLPGKPAETYSIDLKGGTAAIKNFVSYSLPVNKSLRPVVIKLKALNVTEAPVNGGIVKGDIKLSVSFYLQRGEDLVHLVDYNTNTTYQRRPGPAQQIEPLLRSALSNSLVYLNNWMDAQAGGNIKLAKSVKVRFTEYNEPVEGDTIYYNVKRPLKWTDFIGKPIANSRNGAEVFAGLGYDENVKVVNSIVNVTLALKIYVPKSACWVSTADQSDYSLNHEQRHFDIARLVAEHFKQNIAAENLPADNYDGTINMAYLDALREMNKLQKQYDDETLHSRNTYQQQLWNNRIDKELLELGIKVKPL
jgi:hypothetical protein